MPNVNPDSACGMLVQMDENLCEYLTACFQSALLYTSANGERRIRVHTLCLPVKAQISDIYAGADAQAIASLLSKMAVDRTISGNLSDAREAMVNACVDIFGSYMHSLSSSALGGSFLSPEGLRTLPLYVLGLLKHTAFTYGTSIKLDSRVFALCNFRTLPLNHFMLQICPSLYPLHLIDNAGSDLPLLSLSYERIDRHGVYLMDTGDYLFIFVGQTVSEQFCQNVFNVQCFGAISEDIENLPELDNPTSTAVRKFIANRIKDRALSPPIRILRENSPDRDLFIKRLIEDRTDSAFSYIEFLRHILNEIKS